MDLQEFQREWEIGEGEIRLVTWRRQYRDLVLRVHGARDKRLPADPQDRLGFKRSVNADLTFVSCTRACFDRSLEYVDSDIEEWGSGAWTIVSIVEDNVEFPGSEGLADAKYGLKSYSVTVDDWGSRPGKPRPWIRVACRDLAFSILSPVTDRQLPLRP